MSSDVLVDPAFHWVPDHVNTSGPEVADLAELVGLHLDAEQRLVLDAMFAEKADGTWACFEFALVCARQNMKTYVLQAATLGDMFLFDAELGIWTAHLFDTSQEAFRDLDETIAGSPYLSSRMLRVSRANGDEGFELKSGGRLKFKARSKSGGRGLTGDAVTLDEGFALSAKEMGALLPTLSARPNPQVRYASSAGLEDSEILRGVRDRGRKGGDPSLGYIEWCAPEDACGTESCDHTLGRSACALDDPEMWRRANPAMDRRISRVNIAAERRALATEPEEFARERLGWWSNPGAASMPYKPDAWRKLIDLASRRAENQTPVFCLDVNPIRSRSAIAYAGHRDDGLVHVELADYRPGTGWVVKRATELWQKFRSPFYVLADGAAASLATDLEAAGVKVETYTSAEFMAACGLFGDAINDGSIRHIGQDEVAEAILMARKREREGAWTLARKGGDIAPLVAHVVAYHALVADRSAPTFAY